MNLANFSLYDLNRLDKRLSDKKCEDWIRVDHHFRIKKIKDKISIHINRRLAGK